MNRFMKVLDLLLFRNGKNVEPLQNPKRKKVKKKENNMKFKTLCTPQNPKSFVKDVMKKWD